MSEIRFEISATIGPCSEEDADALAEAIIGLPEAKKVAAAVGWARLPAEEPKP